MSLPSPIPHLRVPTHQFDGEQSFISFTIESSMEGGSGGVGPTQQSVIVTRRRRYREFEKLRSSLARQGFPPLNLPGKLLMHSDSAMTQRRKALEKSLVQYVSTHGTNPVLDDFLGLSSQQQSPRTPSSSTSQTNTTMTGAGNNNGPDYTTLENDDIDDEDEDTNDNDSNSSQEHLRFYMPYPLELLAARATSRGEANNAKRISMMLACFSVVSTLAALWTRRKRAPVTAALEGMSFGFVASSLIAFVSHIIPAQREARHQLMGMFGLDVSPTKCSNADDVAILVNAFKYSSPDASASAVSKSPSPRPPPTVTATPQGIPQPKFGTQTDEVDVTKLAMLDALTTERRHVECLAQARLMYQNAPDNVDVAWRLARSLYYCREVDGFDAKAMVDEGMELATRTLDVAPNSAPTLKFVALLTNAASRIPPAGTGERIQAAIAFERLVNKALKIDPSDATLWYMMGRFNFELALLSWMERRGAKALYGAEPPAGTFEDALVNFERSHAIKPTASTFLKIGECLLKLGKDKARGKEYIKNAATWVPPNGAVISAEDEMSVSEAKKMV